MKPNSTTLVIARYEEDLEWITEVPEHFRIIIYNKGTLIPSLSALRRADAIIPRSNVGRESETFIHHIASDTEDCNEWTVFCQGDPFPHSPDFLELLRAQDRWLDIQALSCQYDLDANIPPPQLVERQTGDYLGDLRVRKETYSLYLWTATRFADRGSLAHCEDYGRFHDLPPGSNIATHFLKQAGLDDLAQRSDAADCGRFCYGAIFGVRTRLLRTLRPETTGRLLELTKMHGVHGYVFERLWLHLFGEPFSVLEDG